MTPTAIITAVAAAALAAGAAWAQPRDRGADIQAITAIAQQVIPNPEWLNTPEWERFVQRIGDPALADLDDEDFRREFNRAADDLPFSHFRLGIYTPAGGERPPSVELENADHATAVLRVRRFSDDAEEMTEAIGRIEAGDYRNLIIDLRDMPGGSFPSAAALGRYLSRDAVDTGVYLTRRWFIEHGGYPDPERIAAITPLTELNLDVFAQQLEQTGALRLVLPAHDGPIFKGRVLVLIDNETASAGEPFVEILRRLPGTLIIGEHTAGAMLSGERFPINEHWFLFAPVADYLTPDGRRLDRVGVAPDIEVPSAQALDKALELAAAEPHGAAD